MALVKIAASRCFGPEMIRQPVTPTALQPQPIHMVSPCRPQVPALAKGRSSSRATRGSQPKSSSRVNRGKKIAMGGSMTATTLAVVP